MAYQTIQALPNDVAQIATAHQLGPFSQAYRAGKNYQRVVGGCLIVVGGMLLALFFSLLRNGVAVPGWLGILLVVGSFLIGSLGYGMYGPRVNVSVSALYLFANGLIYSQGRQHIPLLWSQIAGCEIDQNSGNLGKCIMRTKDGGMLSLSNLAGCEELGMRINNAVDAR